MYYFNFFHLIRQKSIKVIKNDDLSTRLEDTFDIFNGKHIHYYNNEEHDNVLGILQYPTLGLPILANKISHALWSLIQSWPGSMRVLVSATIIAPLDLISSVESRIVRPILSLVLTAAVSPFVIATHLGFKLFNAFTNFSKFNKINNLLKLSGQTTDDETFNAKKFKDSKTYFTSLTNNMIEVELTNSRTKETTRTIKLDPINKDSDRKMLNEIIKLYGQGNHFTAFKKPRNGKAAASEQDKIQDIQRLDSKYKRPA